MKTQDQLTLSMGCPINLYMSRKCGFLARRPARRNEWWVNNTDVTDYSPLSVGVLDDGLQTVGAGRAMKEVPVLEYVIDWGMVFENR